MHDPPDDRTPDFVISDESDSSPSQSPLPPTPPRIGRYRVERLLGQGGFGLVYLAYDDQLTRPVAIKVPHARRILRPEDAEAYLTEARTVANLDHPNIVPVHDVGSTAEFPCFIVSMFIDGSDLAKKIKQSRPPLRGAVELVATVAEALHYAHNQKPKLVHRDVKPGNILLDNTGKPYVTDFGLALRERKAGMGLSFVGTPAYMSPEQARGEGHRVDARSDVFSLGGVLYELLTGTRPFQGNSEEELLKQIATLDVLPPRQWDDTIPTEVDRICRKSLSKPAAERYTTAKDMADDLRYWLRNQAGPERSPAGVSPPAAEFVPEPRLPPRDQGIAGAPVTPSWPDLSPVTPSSDRQALKVVPKGLRSFDANDADFFLELLPGARDRNGMPESVRFWKSRIEAREPDETFSVGLIYGPSGCGKSSLVKAGLLPRLAPSVVKVYLEASGADTEQRLLRNLHRRFPGLNDQPGLVEVLAELRRGQGLAPGDKVLLVIDQFEQWLHAGHHVTMVGGEKDAELIRALRQCDGVRVQCLIMVRDDFWLAVSRFMQALEIRVVDGENSRLVDLFDERHARKVLAALGHSFGALPEWKRSKEQNAFLDQAVAGLAQEGKVVSVRLALFAEMVKGKTWTPATLREIGGADGVGVTFLEETFSSPTAPPLHRVHQKTAQAVLATLLPEAGSDIKGHRHSREELLEASGCRNQSRQFDEVMVLLDSELRLVTPADSESLDEDKNSPLPYTGEGQGVRASMVAGEGGHHVPMVGVRAVAVDAKNYQLTHDYLVPSLRTWLTRKQKATRRGRAELRLADLASLWTANPESRRLPSLFEYLQIRLYTPRRTWTESQRKMMGQARRVHALRCSLVAAVLVVAGLAGTKVRNAVIEKQDATRAEGLVEALENAEITKVPAIIDNLTPYRAWADPLLKARFDRGDVTSKQRLNLALALLASDEGQVDYLYDRLINAAPDEFHVIRRKLLLHKEGLTQKLWGVVQSPRNDQEFLCAASSLALFAAEDPRWKIAAPNVAAVISKMSPSVARPWTDALANVKDKLVGSLSDIACDTAHSVNERHWATSILAEYASDRPELLTQVLIDGDDEQFGVVVPLLKQLGTAPVGLLESELQSGPSKRASSKDERIAEHKARAAVALLRLGQPEKVWPLFKRANDESVRSYLIHWSAPLGVEPKVVIQHWAEENDPEARSALLLLLGEFPELVLHAEQRQPVIDQLQLLTVFKNGPDPGLHAASGWLLRKWKCDDEVRSAIDHLGENKADRTHDKQKWYIDRQGQTFVIVDAQSFMMGSPDFEREREENEIQHSRKIGRRYAIAASPVTKAQFASFLSKRPRVKEKMISASIIHPDDSPQVGVSWYVAAWYCNWLSEVEGIPKDQWCYATNEQGDYDVGMRAKDKCLTLTGYRLPTEAEWEFACRAGTKTRFYFGQNDALLANYAWYAVNSGNRTQPVANLKPNDFGLFDMLGNVWQWCESTKQDYLDPRLGVAEDNGETKAITNDIQLVLRGGAYDNMPRHVRAAFRGFDIPRIRQPCNGFRPVRTIKSLPSD